MGKYRKSIFDSILKARVILIWITQIKITQVSSQGLVFDVTTTTTNKSAVLINDERYPSLANGTTTIFDETLIKLNPDFNPTKFQRVETPNSEQEKKEADEAKKKEEFNTFTSFLVEIIVFFVFLAILLSFITICAKKCGGNPSTSGRIYGPGPIMGNLITEVDPESQDYTQVGFTNNFGGVIGYQVQSTTSHGYHPNDTHRVCIAPSDYSDSHSVADELGKSKRTKKNKIPGPTF